MEWITRLRFNEQGHIDLTGRTWTASNTILSEGKFGNKSIYFSGSSYLKTIADAAMNFNKEDFTISVWVKADGVGGGYSSIINAANQYSISLHINLNSVYKPYFYYNNSYIQPTNALAEPLLWNHISITRKSGTTRMFINGIKVAETSAAYDFTINTATGTYIGWDGIQSNSYYKGYIDDLCIIKGIALWESDFAVPTGYLLDGYTSYLTEDDKLYGKVNNILSKLSDNYSSMTAANIKTAIISTNYQLAALNELQTIGKFKPICYSNSNIAPKKIISSINVDTLIVPSSLLSLKSIEGIDSVSITKSLSGTGACKLLVTTDLVTYKTFNGSAFVNIDHTDIATVKTNGISPEVLATITRAQWDTLTTGKTGIGFAYLPTIEEATDTCSIADIKLTVDMKGSWKRPPNYNDAAYEYPLNDVLRVTINTEGSYKINYKE